MRLPALLFLALFAFMPVAWGQDAPRVGLRAGTHPDRGRLVFDWPSRVGYSLEEQEGRVVTMCNQRGIELRCIVTYHPPGSRTSLPDKLYRHRR